MVVWRLFTNTVTDMYIEIFDNGGKWKDSPFIEIGDKNRFYFSGPNVGMYGLSTEKELESKREEIKVLCFEIDAAIRKLNKLVQ